MTNFFTLQCQRLYDNYTFTYRIFSSSDKLIAQLYTQTLNNLESLAKKSLVTGFSHAKWNSILECLNVNSLLTTTQEAGTKRF